MAEMGDLVRTLEGHTGTIHSLAFSHNNKLLASGSYDKTIKIWNVETGELIKTLVGHKNTTFSLVFDKENKKLVSSGSDDYLIKIWNVETGELIKTLVGHTRAIYVVYITNDNKHIISGSGDNTIKVWDLETGNLIKSWIGSSREVRDIKTTLDDKKIISCNYDKTIKIWDFEGNLIRNIVGHEGSVNKLSLIDEDTKIISGSDDKTVKIWDFETGTLINTLDNYGSTVRTMDIEHKKNKYVVVGTNKVLVNDIENGELVFDSGLIFNLEALEVSWDNSLIAIGGSVGHIRLLNFIEVLNYYLKLKNNQLLDKDNNPITLPITDELLEEKGILTKNITQDIINQVLSNEIQLVSNQEFEIEAIADKDLSLINNQHEGEIIISQEEELPIAKIIGYNAPQLMLPNSDIKFNKLKSINDINIKAKDESNKIRVIFSVDSGEKWYSKKFFEGKFQDILIDINDLNDIKTNGMSIGAFNSIKEDWSEQLIASHKVRFAYLLDLDDSSTVSEVDEIKANISMFGGWKLLKKGKDYNYGYTNTQLMVTLTENGTYKVNYIGD